MDNLRPQSSSAIVNSEISRVDKTATNKRSTNKPDKKESTEHQIWMLAVADSRCKRSFASLFQSFGGKVRRLAARQLNNEAVAEEILQEVMTQVWRKAHLYHPDKGAVSTWIYTVTRNLCYDHMRKGHNKNEQNLAEDIWPIFEEVVLEEDIFTDHLSDQLLLNKVSTLPEAQQQVVRGVFFQELSQEQLARQLDIPLGTVKSRLRLAMEKLKLALGAEND